MKERTREILKALGPGILWAGAAIGVSHLAQSTRAGAAFGFGLVWAVLVANLFKYPAFEFGPRYAVATGEDLIAGYKRLGRWALIIYMLLTFATMFAIQGAVTVVTAALATQFVPIDIPLWGHAGIILLVCAAILSIGRFRLLDKLMKILMVALSLSTIIALFLAIRGGMHARPGFEPPILWEAASISFIVALIGWMPSAIDISVWHSIWTLERKKETGHAASVRDMQIDFNVGYIGTVILALCFLSLGALVMYGTGETFSEKATTFAAQFINLYTENLGGIAAPLIITAAFATMFSTTLTVLDAFSRVLTRFVEQSYPRATEKTGGLISYWIFLFIMAGGALLLIARFTGQMVNLIDLATTLSFLSAPVLSYLNHRAVHGSWVPEFGRPKRWLTTFSWIGIGFQALFALAFILWKTGAFR